MIRNYFLIIVAISFIACTEKSFEKQISQLNKEGWELHDKVFAEIKEPIFRDKIFNILDFGALANDTTADNHSAIKKTIEACHNDGGGKVLFPKGIYYINGPIHLLSNVNLVLDSATIIFGANPLDFTPLVLVRWEGTVCYNYSPLIYAYQQENIAITGVGTIDGNVYGGWNKWSDMNTPWETHLQIPERKRIRQMGNDTIPVHQRVFGNGFLDLDGDGKDDGYGDGKDHYLRPCLFEPYECKNIMIDGITIKGSPFWTIHPVFSDNIIFRNLTILKGSTNDDGIDPDGCINVLIEDCFIDTHDDAISIKAGRDQDAWIRRGTENVIVRNCILNSTCNAFCIGSEMSGGVSNVWAYDTKVLTTGHVINFKCNLDRGGKIEKVYVRNIEADSCNRGILFQMDYHGYRGNHYPTKFNDFYLSDIRIHNVKKEGIKIVGVETESIRKVWLNNVTIDNAVTDSVLKFTEDIVFENVKINNK